MTALSSLSFWVQALDQAIKAFAGAALLVFAADQVNVIDMTKNEWLTVLGFGLGGAILSLLLSIASAPFSVDGKSPRVLG